MKKSTLLLTGLMAMSLTACGATTGGLAKSMAKKAAMDTVSSAVSPSTPAVAASAMSAPAQPIDGTMDCAALAKEMGETDAAILAANKVLAGAGQTDLAGNIVATGASQAALHSGAASALAKVPFGGLFAKKAMKTAANAGQKKAEKAQSDLQAANLRKASLTGLYAGKNCGS